MALEKLDNKNVSVHLGKTSVYKSQYDPSLLVREPRQSNRTHLNIQDDNLPFMGVDVWNAYEVSALLPNGVPFTGILKITVPCNNKYIVESKSLKLYLNSYNMTRLNVTEGNSHIETLVDMVKADLNKLLETNVGVGFSTCNGTTSPFGGKYLGIDYITIDNKETLTYTETPEFLTVKQSSYQDTQYLSSALLKSNCRVTSQPDWGDVFIYLKGKRLIDEKSLLKYIISFRDECHFHEEICETIYKRLLDTYNPEELAVTCLYTRRGGIDINPTRASHLYLLDSKFINPYIPHCKTPKQ